MWYGRPSYLRVLAELLTEPDEHAVQPAQHVGTLVRFGAEGRQTRHEDGGRLNDATSSKRFK